MPDTVEIPDLASAAMLAHAEHDAPHEACGLLIGTGRTVVRAVPTANADASATRYTIPADEHFAALRQARAKGLAVIGAYHSHPRGAAEPSPTDAATAFPGFVFVIAGLAPEPHVRAWRFVDGNFVELRLVRT
jgi:proteasome lid subunit RPN8/RPN11